MALKPGLQRGESESGPILLQSNFHIKQDINIDNCFIRLHYTVAGYVTGR